MMEAEDDFGSAERRWYYLHANGDLICKRFEPEVENGGFVRKVWVVDRTERGTAYLLLIEAAAMGARKDRIEELKKAWGVTDEDCQVFADRAGLKLFRDGDTWCAGFSDFKNVQESQVGFGETAFDALVGLCKQGPLGSK